MCVICRYFRYSIIFSPVQFCNGSLPYVTNVQGDPASVHAFKRTKLEKQEVGLCNLQRQIRAKSNWLP